jgi:hypothetical protein
MLRDWGLARALVTGMLFAACASGPALGQTAAADELPAARGADAPAAEQPRRNRERRRAAPVRDVTAATPAPAAPAAPATAAPPVSEGPEATIVCKNIKLTGTKISRRICGTEAQWAAQENRTTDDAQEAMRQVRDRSSIVVSQPDNPLSRGGN